MFDRNSKKVKKIVGKFNFGRKMGGKNKQIEEPFPKAKEPSKNDQLEAETDTILPRLTYNPAESRIVAESGPSYSDSSGRQFERSEISITRALNVGNSPPGYAIPITPQPGRHPGYTNRPAAAVNSFGGSPSLCNPFADLTNSEESLLLITPNESSPTQRRLRREACEQQAITRDSEARSTELLQEGITVKDFQIDADLRKEQEKPKKGKETYGKSGVHKYPGFFEDIKEKYEEAVVDESESSGSSLMSRGRKSKK